MRDYSFLEFIKPEYVKKEELNKYVKYDSCIIRLDIDNWLKWGIINVSDYKEFLKILIERQEDEIRQMKIMLEKAEEYGDKFSPFLCWGMLNGCCCSSEYYCSAPIPKEVEKTPCSRCDLEKN